MEQSQVLLVKEEIEIALKDNSPIINNPQTSHKIIHLKPINLLKIALQAKLDLQTTMRIAAQRKRHLITLPHLKNPEHAFPALAKTETLELIGLSLLHFGERELCGGEIGPLFLDFVDFGQKVAVLGQKQ
jgi:hypothetical protein